MNYVIESDETLSRIRAMVSRESTYLVPTDYVKQVNEHAASLRRPRDSPGYSSSFECFMGPPVDASCRYVMAKWCHSLADFCKYDKDITSVAMNLVDRYAATKAGMMKIMMNRDSYQLAVMTALYTTAKTQMSEALDPESVARLSRGKHSKCDIERMEMEMLNGLGWRVTPATPWAFTQELLKVIPKDAILSEDTRQRLYKLVKYQLEVAACDYELSLKRASEIAFGAILNAMESMNADCTLEYETRLSQVLNTEVHELRHIRVSLLKVIPEDSNVLPMVALLKQRTARTSSSIDIKDCSPSSINLSPKSVSGHIR